MRFTMLDIQGEAFRSLRNYLRVHVIPEAYKVQKKSLVGIYDTRIAILKVRATIHRNRNATQQRKNFKLWENHLVLLKGLTSDIK